MGDWPAEGPTGGVAWGVDYSASVSTPRWHCVIIPQHSYMLMSRVDVSMRTNRVNKEGKLLTNQMTVIVDITITTTLVRAAEHMLPFCGNVVMLPCCSLCFRERKTRVRILHSYKLCIYELRVVLAMYGTRVRVSHNRAAEHVLLVFKVWHGSCSRLGGRIPYTRRSKIMGY
jgi:hypothetical protein